jgi:hypothetical protein
MIETASTCGVGGARLAYVILLCVVIGRMALLAAAATRNVHSAVHPATVKVRDHSAADGYAISGSPLIHDETKGVA